MSKKFLSNIDMDQNEIENLRVQNLNTAPSNAKSGQIYYDKNSNCLFQYNGSQWIPLSGEGGTTADTVPIGAEIDFDGDIVPIGWEEIGNVERAPAGLIQLFGGTKIPGGWLECNGDEVYRADYPELFEVIGTTYGEGNGTTTFNLPNLKGRTIVGHDSEDIDFDSLGKVGGEKTHVLTANEMPKHGFRIPHVAFYNSCTYTPSDGTTFSETRTGMSQEGAYNTTTNDGWHNMSIGNNQSHNNMQPFIVLKYIIKATNSVGKLDVEDAEVIDDLDSESSTDALSAKQGKILKSLIGEGGASGDTLPVGSITSYPSDNIPDNWLLCDGAEISREEYSDLFETIGTMYGAGDGITTFNLPDIKGKIPVGKDVNDTDFNALDKTGGEKTHKLTTDEIPSHRHLLERQQWFSADTVLNSGSGTLYNWRSGTGGTTSASYYNPTRPSPNNIDYTGGDKAHNNMQPYVVTNYIIKAKQSSGVVANVVDNLESDSKINALSAKQGKILNNKIEQKGDPLPIGTIVEYDGDEIPDGYEVVDETEVYTLGEVKTNKIWVDGKPIYRKIIDFGALPKASSKSVAHNIPDLDYVVSITGVANHPDKTSTGRQFPLPFAHVDAAGSSIYIYANNTAVLAHTGTTDRSMFTRTYITLEYTKTTD